MAADALHTATVAPMPLALPPPPPPPPPPEEDDDDDHHHPEPEPLESGAGAGDEGDKDTSDQHENAQEVDEIIKALIPPPVDDSVADGKSLPTMSICANDRWKGRKSICDDDLWKGRKSICDDDRWKGRKSICDDDRWKGRKSICDDDRWRGSMSVCDDDRWGGSMSVCVDDRWRGSMSVCVDDCWRGSSSPAHSRQNDRTRHVAWDIDDYDDHSPGRNSVDLGHAFHRDRYQDCLPFHHDDNPLRIVNGCLGRNGYKVYSRDGHPKGPSRHGYANQYSPMDSLDTECGYLDTSCCSRNLVCDKNYHPVGASLINPQKWTCFLNCILQCVVHTVPLVLKLLKEDHLGPCPRGSDNFCCYCSLKLHAGEVIRLSGDVLYPKKFVNLLELILPDFEWGRHQDAHEFLHCLLDELDKASIAPSPSEKPYSIVKEIFGGQLKSQLHCPQCNHCSDTMEPFLDLNLEVIQMDTVMDALQSFTKVEVFEGFICDGCKSRVNMEKHLKVEQAPEVLVIQLKRFQNLGSTISKIEAMVEYQLELDLNPFMSSPDNKPPKYDLYGVVEHLGVASKGHYVCYIRSSQTDWFLFNDDKVMECSEDMVLDNKAYLLFYVKQGSSPWFSTLLKRKDRLLLLDSSKELAEKSSNEVGVSSDSDEAVYTDCDSGSDSDNDSDEPDIADHFFVGPADKIEDGPSSADLSNVDDSTLWDVPDKNEASCSLGGLSLETQEPTCLLGSNAKNGHFGRSMVQLENKENVSPHGSHDTKGMNHNINGSSQVNIDADSQGGSLQKDRNSCSIFQPSHKHEDDCSRKNSSLHKDHMRGSSDTQTGPPCVRRRIGTSRLRTVGSNSDHQYRDRNDSISKDNGDETKARKQGRPQSAVQAGRTTQQKKDIRLSRYLWAKRRAAWGVKRKPKRRRR